jgi:GR25 family glycosyltransferase involved in LPS biosynthesis
MDNFIQSFRKWEGERKPDTILPKSVIIHQLDNLGITFERFSAIDGTGKDPITACRDSHLEVWKQNLGKKVLILEDDAYFIEGFQERFDEVIQTLPENWDVFYLGVLLDKMTGKVIKVNSDWYRQVVSTGTQAYCLHPDMMQYFIDKIEIYDGYIDVGLRILAGDTNAYITQPNLVTQSPGYSDLRLKEVSDF